MSGFRGGSKDIAQQLISFPSLEPALFQTSDDADGATVDTQGYEGVALAAQVGGSGDTLSGSVLFELQMEDSPDDSIWTDVVAADMIGGTKGANGQFALIDEPAVGDSRDYVVGYIGRKRYVRAVIVVTGTHTVGTILGVSVVLSSARRFPLVSAPIV